MPCHETKVKKRPEFKEILLILGIAFFWNEMVYTGARQIAQSWYHYNLTTFIDQFVPFLPWTIVIYLGCFLFWAANYVLCAIQEKSERDRFFCADILAKGICFCFFVLIPTTNIRPEITGETMWDTSMKLLYQVDAADNLFPSIHCIVSWFCWIGVRNRKNIFLIYRAFSLVMAVAVCISTLTTRQHVIVDVVGGILLAEISYLLAGLTKIRAYYTTSISLIKNKLFP